MPWLILKVTDVQAVDVVPLRDGALAEQAKGRTLALAVAELPLDEDEARALVLATLRRMGAIDLHRLRLYDLGRVMREKGLAAAAEPDEPTPLVVPAEAYQVSEIDQTA